MREYGVSLAVGILAGIIYGILGEPSPAPPTVALVGLLGILLGEQVVPISRRLIAGEPINIAWLKRDCGPHIFGSLPTRVTKPVVQKTDDSQKPPISG